MHSTPRLLIGVDPGLVTGLAWLIDDYFSSIELPPMKSCDQIAKLLRRRGDRPAVISVERYSITQQTVKLTRQYDALEVIGACRWLAHTERCSFAVEGASSAQRVGNREVLRTLGWWFPGGDHLNKAAAQVALAYQRAFPLEFTRRLEPGMIN